MVRSGTSALLALAVVVALPSAAQALGDDDPPKVTITSNSLIENDQKAMVKLACSAGVGKCRGKVEVYSKGKVQVGQTYKPITVIASTSYKGDPERLMKLKLTLTADARSALTNGAFEVVIAVDPSGDGKSRKKTVTLNP